MRTRGINWANVKETVAWMSLCLLVMAALICMCSGCSADYSLGDRTSHPGLTVIATPFKREVKLNSNAEAGIDYFYYDPKTGTIQINDFKINQDSATPSQYDADIIEKTGIAQEWQTHYVGALTKGIADIVSEVMPVFQLLAMAKVTPTSQGFNLTLPTGTSIGAYKNKSSTEMATLFSDALTKLQTLQKSNEALQAAITTQPAATQPATTQTAIKE